MLLTHLQENVVKRPKTIQDLRKLLDMSGCVGLEAASENTVEIVGDEVRLANLVTAGSLPFKFKPRSRVFDLELNLPTIVSYEGSGLEEMHVRKLVIGKTLGRSNGLAPRTPTVPNKLRTLKGLPKVMHEVRLIDFEALKTLEGLRAPEASLTLQDMHALETFKGLDNVVIVTIYNDCPKLRFRDFPKTAVELNIEGFTPVTGLPWYVTLSPHLRIRLSSGVTGNERCFFNLQDTVPMDVQKKIIKMQSEGQGSRVHMLEAQADLIEADCPDKLTDF